MKEFLYSLKGLHDFCQIFSCFIPSDTFRSKFQYDSTFSIYFQSLELEKCDEKSSNFWEYKPWYLNEYTRLLGTSEFLRLCTWDDFFNLTCKKISKSVAAELEHNIFENLDSMAKDLGPPHSFEIWNEIACKSGLILWCMSAKPSIGM